MKKILLAFALLGAKQMMAQVAATNTGVLYISNGSSTFYAAGNLTNNAGAALTNNGALYVHGNLSNSQVSMAVGTGTLYLNGTSAQAVNGAQPFRTLNFVSNNASGITLNNNLSVTGAHTFTAGIITTSATPNYLVYESGSSYSNDGDTRHVNGWVKKFGSTNFIFPVGNGTVERNVEITSLSASSEFNARYFPALTPTTTSRVLPLRAVDDWEYWAINRVSGGTAAVHLNWNYAKVYFPNYIIPDIVVAGWNGTAWVDNGGTAAGVRTATGNITSTSQSTFNRFTFGSKSWVLPVTLISFNASKQDNYTNITWSTANETNADHFVVERSDDGSSFYTVTTTPARNNSTTEFYTARDNAPIRLIAYYRLRSIDKDGKESISKIVTVTDNANSNLTLITNPVRNKVALLATGHVTGEFSYQLFTINGQLVQTGTLNIQNAGQHEIQLNSRIIPGTYSLKVANQKQNFSYKLVVMQ